MQGVHLPTAITEPLLQNEDVKDYLTKTITPVLLRGVAELCKIKPADPVVSGNFIGNLYNNRIRISSYCIELIF